MNPAMGGKSGKHSAGKVPVKLAKDGHAVKRRKARGPKGHYFVRGRQFRPAVKKALRFIGPAKEISISTGAVGVMSGILADVSERVASKAKMLARMCGRKTIHFSDVMGGVKLVFVDNLAVHAIAEMNRTMAKYREKYGKK